MQIPAICNNCNSVIPSGIEVENCLNFTLEGGTTNCPFCGGIAHMMDGTFNIIGDTISVLKSGNVTKENLSLLLDILKKNKDATSSEKIKKEINETVPELNTISDALPKTRTELYAFITLLALIIQTFIMINSNNDNKTIDIENAFYQTNYYLNGKELDNNDISNYGRNKIGRNEPCPCGSGQKYKKCCLRKEEIAATSILNFDEK